MSREDEFDVVIAGTLSEDLSDIQEPARRLLFRCKSAICARSGTVHLRQMLSGQAVQIEAFPASSTEIVELVSKSELPLAVLASGDPGFFGVLRLLKANFPHLSIRVLPAPSSISVAFARLALPWDDARVISGHGRPMDEVAGILRSIPELQIRHKLAFLTSRENPPQSFARLLLELGVGHSAKFVIAEDLESSREQIQVTTLDTAARSEYSPRSVAISILGRETPEYRAVSTPRALTQCAPANSVYSDSEFYTPTANFTKVDIRLAALAHLHLDTVEPGGIFFDLGAGYGTVGITAKRLHPHLRVIGVEAEAEKVSVARQNADHFQTEVEFLTSSIEEVASELPYPAAVFIGGGGVEVLDLVVSLYGTDIAICATYASPERAMQSYHRLGNLMQLQSTTLNEFDGGTRLVPNNPIFMTWNQR